MAISIVVTSVMVDDQAKAHHFYTEILGFETRKDIPLGHARWLTVGSAQIPGGVELLLEPTDSPAIGAAAKAWQATLRQQEIPATSFGVDDLDAEYARLTALGVHFTMAPTVMGPVKVATIDDTCGNLIQLAQAL